MKPTNIFKHIFFFLLSSFFLFSGNSNSLFAKTWIGTAGSNWATNDATPSISGDLEYCNGGNTTLNAGSWSSYSWSNGEDNQTIEATAGTYTVTVTDNSGSTGTDQVTVTENESPNPNIYTPNFKDFEEIQKILASDKQTGDRFGSSVAISENLAIVGAAGEDTGGFDAGAAYIFEKDQSGTNWVFVKKIQASDKQGPDYFGQSVSISGNLAIVGAFGEDGGSNNTGAAYIFEKDHGGINNWGEIQKIQASDKAALDQFGYSVSISGTHVIVGAHLEDTGGFGAGAAYIFEKDQGGINNWGEVKKILASDQESGNRFGTSVSISGNHAIVGAYGEDTGGTAYIFEKDHGGINNWGEAKKILASDREEDDEFGFSVSILGNCAVVGARSEVTDGHRAGAAYIFEKNQGGNNNWGEVKKILASDKQTGDRFGVSVAISGNYVVVGAHHQAANTGAAYIFEKNQGGINNWGEVKKIQASDGEAGDLFGSSVAMSGNHAIVGAFRQATNTGTAYIFQTDFSYCAADEGIILDAGVWSEYKWSNDATTQIIQATAGTYTVTVTDSNGCTGTAMAEVNAIPCLAEAGVLTTNENTICSGENLDVSARGLSDDANYLQYFFIYTQDNLGNTTLHKSIMANVEMGESSSSFGGLEAGDYLVCSYNEGQDCLPNPSPITTDLDDIFQTGNLQNGCFAMECTTITIPKTFEAVSGEVVDTDNAAGQFIYIAEVCGGALPYNVDFEASGGFAIVDEFPGSTTKCRKYRMAYVPQSDWTLTITDANGCSDEGVVFAHRSSDYAPQIVDYVTSQETCLGMNDGSINIDVEGGIDGCNEYTYTWSGFNGFDSTVEDGVTGCEIDGLQWGIYKVIVTDCNGLTAVMENIPVGRATRGRGRRGVGCKTAVDDLADNMGLKAFPNPFSHQTSIEFTLPTASKVWLSIYSIEGQKVADILQGEAMEGETLKRFGFDAAELQNGMYILELRTESGLRQHQQLVVVK